VTVIIDAAGRYFASFVVQIIENESLAATENEVGIDLGLTHFAVMSDGAQDCQSEVPAPGRSSTSQSAKDPSP
jgi:transposase